MAAVASPWAALFHSWGSNGLSLQNEPVPCWTGEPVRPQEVAQAIADSAKGLLSSSSYDAKAAASHRVGKLVNASLERFDIARNGEASADLTAELLANDVPRKLLECLQALEFEDRKSAARLLDVLIRRVTKEGGEAATQVVEYVRTHPVLVSRLLEGCQNEEVFFLCAQLVRSCVESEELTKAMLEAGSAPHLLGLAAHENFEISSEAFGALQNLLVSNKRLSAPYVQDNFAQFFTAFHVLLTQERNYVIQRQAIRLLAELLLDAEFQPIMSEYVKNAHFLQIHMNLLINDSVAIQLEAFHIFKLFVANPFKPPRVQVILARNRRGLIRKLRTFYDKQKGDENFSADLTAVLDALAAMEA
mmetsp:Transcript_103780/g.300181  ORF Transcript_103780/g.300181 Transcript_103780/m.300181 type:complete len:361 (-) Transcript_103780:155-1237(-)